MSSTLPHVRVIPRAIEREGYAILENIVDARSCDDLLDALDELPASGQDRRRGGRRNLLAALPMLCELVRRSPLRELAETILGPKCFAVRVLLFDKTPEANWLVKWHQDATIAVRERREVSGYGPWSVKEGVPHVRPPVRVLEGMVTLRLHLDDCDSDNGPLRVIPGTHLHGLLTPHEVQGHREHGEAVECTAGRGGVVAMRPLLLHSSLPAQRPSRRRVLHLEYAAVELDPPLEWHERR